MFALSSNYFRDSELSFPQAVKQSKLLTRTKLMLMKKLLHTMMNWSIISLMKSFLDS